ncbi:PTS sugar transporter subunit IIA [Caproiciproducens sp. MSJ-32]|uniref:PTS sugar transporter subunit IIA n=1 Tax=Caproiciproducens sp. MSJ-32 TaxID=2841527 RepID=UPI001C11E53A|nr:PTS sugar transporter subunit IIA [Caproiciproducens sp. MSJ-32]MBU5455062.1 PTS sugar transporter subunit IIA [Caproiciproducens sp. MSJ-32]
MLIDILREELIKLNVKCNDWKEAIEEGAYLLEKEGIVNKNYKEAIINNFYELGPYMVIAPGIVLSHARPEAGVNKNGISILTLESPIEFGSELNDPVKLIITLAAKDNTSHLSSLSKLMEILMNSDDLNSIINAKTVQEVVKIIEKYS